MNRTEIPEEILLDIPDLRELIDGFSDFLQIMSEMKIALLALVQGGHFAYQAGFTEEHSYSWKLDGKAKLRSSLAALQKDLKDWDEHIDQARSTHFFLNYYSARETLKLIVLLKSATAAGFGLATEKDLKTAMSATSSSAEALEPVPQDGSEPVAAQDAPGPATPREEGTPPDYGEVATFAGITGQSEETAVLWVSRFHTSEQAINQFFALEGMLPLSPTSSSDAPREDEEGAAGGSGERKAQEEEQRPSQVASIIHDFQSMLYATSSSVDLAEVIEAMQAWARTEDVARRASKSMAKDEPEPEPEDKPGSGFEFIDVKSADVLAVLVDDEPNYLLGKLGQLLGGLSAAQSAVSREIDPPSESVENRSDMVGVVIRSDDEDRSLPIWATCASSPVHVIDCVLSIYVRRGRLPEPGEILFCTTETTLEEIELLFRRFLGGKANGRSDAIFCLADIHTLSYTTQVAVVNVLQAKIGEHGTTSAADLLIVSGRPRQVILNSLSAHALDCPPLPPAELQRACTQASASHGASRSVRSDMNGQGKSTLIMKTVAEQQRSESICYRRIPVHEATTVAAMIRALGDMTQGASNAVHLDVGHIIPASANTVLFELLVVGFIRDPKTSRVYNRRPKDTYFLEVPNSLGDKTATALRFSSFLPEEHVACNPETLSLHRPKFASADGTQLDLVEYEEVVFVAKMLRATKNQVFVFGSPTYNLSYQPQGSLTEEQENKIMEFCAFTGSEPPQAQAWLDRYGWEVMVALNVMMDGEHDPPAAAAADTDITLPECFELLREYIAQNEGEELNSFTTLSNFVQFMHPSFKSLTEWPLINDQVNQEFTNHQFKDSFVKMLIATAKDFSTRSVAAGAQAPTESDVDDGAPMQRTPSGNVILTRQGSDVGAALQRQQSAENVHRFDSMISWEQSDHPVAVWKLNFGGMGVDGVDILSMNPAFVQQYLNDNLRHILRGHGMEFDRDWKKLTNEQAIDLLCHAMGRSREARPRLQTGYVITVDNLLKMLSIALRMRCGLPVIVMGETGCGKSSLMRATSTILGFRLHTLNIHGGLADDDIVEFVEHVLVEVAESPKVNDYGEVQTHVLFFDEVNTCNSMGLFKEILCDGTIQGRRLPESVKVIAACNPYRLKSGGALHEKEDGVGLVFQHDDGISDVENVGTGIKDPLSDLVYRVHPLPESMVDHLFDFGALSKDTERLYIKAMVKKALADYIDEEAMVEEVSGDDNLAAQAQRMGIEFTEEMTEEDRQQIIRQRMREMLDAEAQRRQQQGEAMDDLAQEMGQQQRGGGIATKALSRFGEFVETFTELVCTAQEFVRSYYGGERSSASLRDVARCISVYRWFGEHFSTVHADGKKPEWTMAEFFSVSVKAREHVRSATIMSLAYCYHSRLPREQRMLLRHALTDAWLDIQVPAKTTAYGWYIAGKEYCTWLTLTADGILDTITAVQRSFVNRMKFPAGIALNEALCENVFMILVSTLNQIPIFVVGKPGTSKSLAMELVQTNLQGKASGNDFLRSLPAVQTFSYQCSPLSTSAGIQQAFDSAKRYKMEAPNTVVVVLLDEVGLAEQSPHLPLKVLHKTLDEAGSNESVVGISNWSLDPAKMNRAVHLYRPAPTVEDLALTAEGMVEKTVVKGYLQAVAKAFSEVYQSQKLRDFFGMREFYSTVRSINAALGESSTLEGGVVMNAVLRNYGGRPDEIESVITSFFSHLSMATQGIPRPPVMELAAQNIAACQDARHLMLLTRNNAALSLMFDHSVLDHSSAVVMFGSDFPDDNTDLQVCLNIQRVKHCMARGTTLVLVHCEALYESMYDLLNQHYTSVGGQLWVRLAFGTHSRLCPIGKYTSNPPAAFAILQENPSDTLFAFAAPEFRVIVIVEKIDAYTRLAPPLLNRFEKQVMERRDMMKPNHLVLAHRLKAFIKAFSAGNLGLTKEGRASLEDCKRTLCGFHSDMVPSLVLSVLQEAENGGGWYGKHDPGSEIDWDRVYAEAVNRLIMVASPEAACRVLQDQTKHKFLVDEHQVDVPGVYFKEQAHSDLPSFADNMRTVRRPGRPQLQQIMTFSPLFLGAAAALESHGTWDNVSLCVLHDLSSERDLQSHIDAFFETAEKGSLLLIQCDPRAASFRRVEHARYMCEAGMDSFVRSKGEDYFTVAEPEPELEPEPEPEADAKGESKGEGKGEKDQATVAATEPKPVAKGVDVILLCHLPRSTENLPFSIDFGPRWSFAFVDSIMPASTRGLLGVEAMMQHKMGEMIEMVDLGTVLSSTFQYAISRLVYLYQRSNEDVRKQVGDTLACLRNGAFVSIVRTCMLAIIKSNGLELDLSALSDHNASHANGTFMEVLHRQFTDALSAMFAVVLSHMDRNGGLPLFLEAGVRGLWTHLFTRSFKGQHIQHKDTLSMNKLQFRLEVPTDGKDKSAFGCKCPFSFYLYRLLQGLRESVTAIAATNDSNTEDVAIAQFKLLSVGYGVDSAVDEELLQSYIHDFACMHLMNTKSATKPQQAVILRRVLELHRPDTKLENLAGVHGRAWDCANRITLHLQLLDALTGNAAVAAVGAVLQLLERSADEFLQTSGLPTIDAAVDVSILQCILEHLDPTSGAQRWETADDYGAWLVQVDSAKPAVLSVLADASRSIESHAKIFVNCRLRWEQYTLVRSLLLDIFVPLGVEPVASKPVIVVLLEHELRSQTVLHRLMKFLCVDLTQQDADKSPVLKRGAAAVMELFISDIACSSEHRLSNAGLAADLLKVVAMEDIGGMDGVSGMYGLLLPSEAGRVALLSELLHIDDSDLQRDILTQLKASADVAVGSPRMVDAPLCQTWLTVVEENLTAQGLAADKLVERIHLEHLTTVATPPVADLIHTVAAIRTLLLRYAGLITVVIDPVEGTPVAAEAKEGMELHKAMVDPVLAVASGVGGSVRSMRMYLLKTLERARGVAFVRSCMQQHPLQDSDWLQEWLAENEGGLIRFQGQNKLPQNNPLATEPRFAEISHAITAFLSSGSLLPIEEAVSEHSETDSGLLKSALCTVLFHEVGLLEVLPDALTGETKERVLALRAWLETTPVLDGLCCAAERKLLRFCAGGLTTGLSAVGESLALGLQSTPEKIVTTRLLVHLAARVLASESGDQFAFLRTILLNPKSLKASYWPSMADDPLFMVQRALMEAGADRGAKRWFTCPNGHPFAIGQCGGAMQRSTCPECGEEIGGEDHTLAASNKVIGEVTGGDANALFQASILQDNSDPGYCLRDVQSEAERFFAARELSAQTLRTVRLMLHGLLTVGGIIGGATWQPDVTEALNTSYTTKAFEADPAALFWAHWQADFSIVKELLDVNSDECALLLHEAILLGSGLDVEGDAEDENVEPEPSPEEIAAAQAIEVQRQQRAERQRQIVQDELNHLEEQHQQNHDEREQLLAGANREDAAEAPQFAQEADQQRYHALNQAADQLEEGIEQLREAIAIHQHRIDHPEEPGDQPSLPVEEPVPAMLATSEERIKWEAALIAALGPLLAGEGKAARLREIEGRYMDANDEGAVFKDELQERTDVGALNAAVRQAACPGLWRFRRAFTFEHFQASFLRDPKLAESHPVLSELLSRQSELSALRHLPQLFRWLELLMQRNDKRLDRKTARSTTVAEMIAGLPSSTQRDEWQEAFRSFSQAWQLAWSVHIHQANRHHNLISRDVSDVMLLLLRHKVEAFGCQPVPAMYRTQEMGDQVVVAFSLPGPTDEGMCPDFLAQALVNTHNDFVQRVDQALLLRNQDVQRHATRITEVTSTFMTQAHALSFNLQDEFVPHVAKHCIAVGDDGEEAFDFENAETFLVERYFRNKPLLNLRLRGFNYADEQTAARANLGAKVKQEALPHAIGLRIREQLVGVAAAQHALGQMETVSNFLAATLSGAGAEGRGAMGEMMLGSHLTDDLRMSEDEVGRLGSTITQQVALKHLDALCEQLRGMAGVDPMDAVSAMYRAELEEEAELSLRLAAQHLDMALLLPVLRGFLVAQCVGEVIPAGDALRNSLDWATDDESGDFLSELPWFAQHFPQEVPMGCAVAALALLTKLGV